MMGRKLLNLQRYDLHPSWILIEMDTSSTKLVDLHNLVEPNLNFNRYEDHEERCVLIGLLCVLESRYFCFGLLCLESK